MVFSDGKAYRFGSFSRADPAYGDVNWNTSVSIRACICYFTVDWATTLQKKTFLFESLQNLFNDQTIIARLFKTQGAWFHWCQSGEPLIPGYDVAADFGITKTGKTFSSISLDKPPFLLLSERSQHFNVETWPEAIPILQSPLLSRAHTHIQLVLSPL